MEKFLGIHKWHLRLTINEEMEIIQKFADTLSVKYILCSEVGHFHCYFESQDDEKILRKKIQSLAGLARGNKGYSLAPVRKVAQMKKYILKDGHYVFRGFEEKQIKVLRKCSNKKGKDKFSEELNALEEKYLGNDITFSQFGKAVISLKINYGQNLYGNHIRAYLNKMRCKNDPSYISQYFEELMR